MTRQFSNVSSAYGAPMGRSSQKFPPEDMAPRSIRLFRVRLDSGGYDDGGAYWGTGAPLYCAEGDDYRAFHRAYSREEARAMFGIPQSALIRPTKGVK